MVSEDGGVKNILNVEFDVSGDEAVTVEVNKETADVYIIVNETVMVIYDKGECKLSSIVGSVNIESNILFRIVVFSNGKRIVRADTHEVNIVDKVYVEKDGSREVKYNGENDDKGSISIYMRSLTGGRVEFLIKGLDGFYFSRFVLASISLFVRGDGSAD